MTANVLLWMTLYYACGVLLTAGGVVPGWVNHNWSWWQAALIVVVGGVIWLPVLLLFAVVFFLGTETRS